MNSVKEKLTDTKRSLAENSWFSGLFDDTKFKPNKDPQTTTFQKVEAYIRDTAKTIDTYDLVFNAQMPSLANSPFLSQTRDDKFVDYYCNNKIHIRMYFKDERLFDNLTGTQCILTPPIYRSKQTSNFRYASSGERSDIKSSGMYISSFDDIGTVFEAALNQALEDGKGAEVEAENKRYEAAVIDAKTNKNLPTPTKLVIPNRTGPFAESKEGITKDNVQQKLKNSKYLDAFVRYVDDIISPPGKSDNPALESPFKVYDTQYTKPVSADSNGLISTTNFTNVKENKKFIGKDEYEYYMQFDFDLNTYRPEIDENGNILQIVKKTDSSTSDESLLLLLKKNEWISIVFQSINIPFDVRSIPADMVKIELQIDNDYPGGNIGVKNVFYKNFFCQYLDMSLSKMVKTPIVVHDVLFLQEDMLRALRAKSSKYFSKVAQLNNLARKVLYYYLKNIDDVDGGAYSSTYRIMTEDVNNAKTITDGIVSGDSANISKTIAELKEVVKKSNSDIRKFSKFFMRDNIKVYRKKFFEALLRSHLKSALSAVSEDNITKELKGIDNFEEIVKPGVVNVGPTIQNTPLVLETDKKGNPTVVSGMSQEVSQDKLNISGGGYDGGGDVAQSQEGGEKPVFQSDDYTLMIPMTIRDPGTGINDMTVRIHKIHLKHIDEITEEDDDNTSLDIKVGDTVRFVYNDIVTYAIICGFKPGKDLNDDGSDKAMNMTDFRTTYIDISKTFESQDLKLTPDQFLSLTNLRGIKYLPFKYVDDTYSFVSYEGGSAVEESLNQTLKRAVNGRFNFSCKESVIPILPNGYIMPFTSRFKEGAKTLLNKLNPFSTKADIGKDNTLPQYSLPSYMTMEKVLVPPNFSEVVKLLKESREDNPDAIFDKLKKIMENNGLNESNDCKQISSSKMASEFESRKKTFMSDASNVKKLFNQKYVVNGKVVNIKGAMQYIKN